MGKRIFPAIVGGVLAFGMVMGTQGALGQAAEHCPNHQEAEDDGRKFSGPVGGGTFEGVVFNINGPTVTLTNTNNDPVTVEWCAKGGTNFSGGSMTSGVLSTDLGAAGSGDESDSVTFDQNVSYVVVYSVEEGGGNGGEPPGNGNGGGGGSGGGGNGDGGGGGGGGGEGAAPAEVIEEEQPTVTG